MSRGDIWLNIKPSKYEEHLFLFLLLYFAYERRAKHLIEVFIRQDYLTKKGKLQLQVLFYYAKPPKIISYQYFIGTPLCS